MTREINAPPPGHGRSLVRSVHNLHDLLRCWAGGLPPECLVSTRVITMLRLPYVLCTFWVGVTLGTTNALHRIIVPYLLSLSRSRSDTAALRPRLLTIPMISIQLTNIIQARTHTHTHTHERTHSLLVFGPQCDERMYRLVHTVQYSSYPFPVRTFPSLTQASPRFETVGRILFSS